eukprot:scaffold682_cov355-Prasinococcus_capsulatus_cf.AAC.7
MDYKTQSEKLAGPIALLKLFCTRTQNSVVDEACQVRCPPAATVAACVTWLTRTRWRTQIFGGRALTRTGMGRIVEGAQRATPCVNAEAHSYYTLVLALTTNRRRAVALHRGLRGDHGRPRHQADDAQLPRRALVDGWLQQPCAPIAKPLHSTLFFCSSLHNVHCSSRSRCKAKPDTFRSGPCTRAVAASVRVVRINCLGVTPHLRSSGNGEVEAVTACSP